MNSLLLNLKLVGEQINVASQTVQVFYTPLSKDKNWHVTIATKQKDLFEMETNLKLEVYIDEGVHSNLTYEDESNDVGDDIIRLTPDEPSIDMMEENDYDNTKFVHNTSESDPPVSIRVL